MVKFKKRCLEKQQSKEFEFMMNRNQTRKFYQNVNKQPQGSACKDRNDDLTTNKKKFGEFDGGSGQEDWMIITVGGISGNSVVVLRSVLIVGSETKIHLCSGIYWKSVLVLEEERMISQAAPCPIHFTAKI
uniref:Uncharacterized protein n=1 Tax=Megaselia scalaris TaxID=36166 RepID=T1GTL3_MEGSC